MRRKQEPESHKGGWTGEGIQLSTSYSAETGK